MVVVSLLQEGFLFLIQVLFGRLHRGVGKV
jgi:hypothetical protein